MEALKQLHASVAQTFGNCFDTAYRDLNATLIAYEARVKDAESRAKAAVEARQKAVSEANVLRHEITLLQEEICHNEIDSKEGEKATEFRQQLEEKYAPRLVLESNDTSETVSRNLEILGDRYTELYEQVGTLVKTSGSLRGQTKRHKRKLEQLSRKMEYLQSCLQRQEFTYMIDGEIVKFERVETTGSNDRIMPLESPPEGAAPLETSTKDRETSSLPHNSNASTTGVNRDEGVRNIEKRPGEQHSEVASTPSDASVDELPPITPNVSSVRSHSLKRKRPGLDHTGRKGKSSSESANNGRPEHPIMVKSETMSSSPLRTGSPHFMPHGTQDLDDIGDSVITPTKRVRFYKSQGLQPPRENFTVTIGPLLAQYMAIKNNSNDDNELVHKGPGVLQPVDGNMRILNGPSQAPNKRRTRDPGRATRRISSITEDGDENHSPTFAKGKSPRVPQGNSSRRHPSSDHRLSDLLEGQSPTSRTLQSKLNPKTQARSQNRALQSYTRSSPLPSRSEIEATSTTVSTTQGSPRSKPILTSREITAKEVPHRPDRMSQMEAMPNDEPYRARPVQRLGLEHFRINPDFNHGFDFAYDDVIRRKEERKCVSGCTRPGCCGDKFSAMVRFGIPINTSGKEMSDREVLEEYLGEEKELLDRLSSPDRQRLLVEAKARVFSNRFGRHKHQHHRPGTPPGFWRAEMPGTQELEKDREEAQKREREKVRERYREAMRLGGQWIFADE
ncbi:DNA repair protein endonuclease SAE2/CtIP C-terminus-domain-containing protein [Aspergillus spectabilis]